MNLEQVINDILKEAKELSLVAERSNQNTEFRFELAKQLAGLVAAKTCVLLSPSTYNMLSVNNELPPPLTGNPNDLKKFIEVGAGICGHHVEFAIQVFSKAKIPVRDVQVYYYDDNFGLQNHTFAEAFWDDSWRMID